MTDMNHVIRFGLVQAAFGWFLQFCLGILKTPSTANDATIVRYTGLVFGIINFVFMFTGAACGIGKIECGVEPSPAAATVSEGPATQSAPATAGGGAPAATDAPATATPPAPAEGPDAPAPAVSGPVPPAKSADATPKRPNIFSRMLGAANKVGQEIGDAASNQSVRDAIKKAK